MKHSKLIILAFTVLIATTELSFSQTTSINQTVDSLTTAIIKVKGVTCPTDLNMISTAVDKVQGVRSCEVKKQGAVTTLEVKYDLRWVTKKNIVAAIENTASCENKDERPYKVRP